ncbi:MAG: hypothetical protein IJY31_06340 [Muribaculaceae bacterium]|nr:hypothetical protein [Muribaculaceae bacterium]
MTETEAQTPTSPLCPTITRCTSANLMTVKATLTSAYANRRPKARLCG